MGALKLPIFMYAGIKAGLTRLKFMKDFPDFIILQAVLLTVICIPVAVVIYLILAVYRLLINIYLFQRHQQNYRGLMEGIDTVCSSQENCVGVAIAFVDFKGTVHELKECTEKQLESLMATKHDKVFYSRSSFLGIHYYYRKYLPPSAYIQVMDVASKSVLTKKELSIALVPYGKAPLPNKDRSLFQVIICKQNIQLDLEPGNGSIYALMYRSHHCLGDGRSVMQLFKGVLADKEKISARMPEINRKLKSKPRVSAESVRRFMTDVNIKDFPMSVSDCNVLRGTDLTEEKYLAWFSDSSNACIEVINKVRKSVSGLTFLDIINTSVASSLYDHYKKKGRAIPESVIAAVALSPDTVSYTYCGIEHFTMMNRFSGASFRLPIDVGPKGAGKLFTRLRMLKKEYDLVKNSFDVQFNFWCTQNLFNKIPSQLIKWVANFVEVTIGISSFPGCDQFTFFGGSIVKDFLLMAPNSPGTGLHILFHTYKGHLRVCLTADKSVIETYDEAQEIVDRTIAYLHELGSEDLQS